MNDKKLIPFVDDDELVHACFQTLLERRFDVEVVGGVLQALFAIEMNGPYSVITTELSPRTTRATVEALGALMRGNAALDSLQQALITGIIFKVIHKPIPSEHLISILGVNARDPVTR